MKQILALSAVGSIILFLTGCSTNIRKTFNEPSRPLVLSKLKHCFPDEGAATEALTLLDLYGVETYEQDRDRVQLAVLKLSEGDLSQLRSYVEAAKLDYRDVLAWAEYPEQMETGASRFNLSAKDFSEIEQRDRQQYLNWLQSDRCK